MLDLETLACQPDAVILSVAAVKFDPFEDYKDRGIKCADLESINIIVDLDTQPDRHVDERVIEWWSQQSKEAQDIVFQDNRTPFPEALDLVHKFIWNSDRVWCQGTSFDISIMEHAYRSLNKAYPWQYWQVRDSRTLLDMVKVNLPTVTHDALDDCYRQIIGVQKALGALGVKNFIRNK